MPLLPQIAMGVQMPQVALPDWGQLMSTSANLENAQSQRMVRDLAFAEALRKRQEEQDISAYLRGQGQGGMQSIATLADQVPQAAPGTYVQAPGTVTTPGAGMTYQRAPAAMQPRQAAPSAPRLPTSQEMVQQFGLPGLQYAQQLEQMQTADVTQKARTIDLQMKALDHVSTLYGTVKDQRSMNAANKAIAEAWPTLAEALPQTYTSKEDIDAFRLQLVPMKDRLARSQTGLTLQYGVNEQNQIVPLQTTGSGTMVQPALPPNVKRILPPTQVVQTPTTAEVITRPGGQSVQTIQKDVSGAAQQKATGTKLGEEEGTRPQRHREAQGIMSRLDAKHELVLQKIREAKQIIQTSMIDPTGPMGSRLTGLTPAATNLDTTLAFIRNNLGLAELRDLKQVGGVGLGSVTEGEHRLLQDSEATIQQRRTTLPKDLDDLEKQLTAAKQRRHEAFRREFVERPGASSGGGPQQGRQPTLEDVEAEIQRRQRSGNAP